MTLVCVKLLCAAAPPHEYEAVTAVLECGGYSFTAKGRTTLCEGWRGLERAYRLTLNGKPDEDEAEPETVLPELSEGQTLRTRRQRLPSVTRNRRLPLPKIHYFQLWKRGA